MGKRTITDTINVFFPESTSSSWLGGLHYYYNLFTALKTVTHPRIKPFIIKPDEECSTMLLSSAEVLPLKKTPYYYAEKKILLPLLNKQFDVRNYVLNHAKVPIDVLSHTDLFCKKPVLFWIADFQHIHMPEMFTPKQLKERISTLDKAVENASVIILSSYDAFKDLKKVYPSQAHKGMVLHFTAILDENMYFTTDSCAPLIKAKYSLPEKYFYVPNQFWKHKNHLTVFKAVADLKKRGILVYLVCSGNTVDGRNPDHFKTLQQFANDNDITENIYILGIIERTELFYLMRNCISIINPSLFEGWSSTVEEAKSLGKNIILSALNVHKEQNPPEAEYFAPENAAELAEIMQRKWQSEKTGPDFHLEAEARKSRTARIHDFGVAYQQIVLKVLKT